MTSSTHNNQPITVARVGGFLSAMLGLVVLTGWALGSHRIKSILPGAVEMRANTAVGFLLAGLALFMVDARATRQRRRLGQVLAWSVAVLGLASLAEHFFGWRLGIDEFLFRDDANVHKGMHGLMSPFTAAAFASIGLGLASLLRGSLRWFTWAAATLTFMIGSVAFIGYTWNASELLTSRYLPPLAVNTAAGFILLGGSTLLTALAPAAPTRRAWSSLSSIETKTLAAFLATLLLLLLAGRQTYRAAADAAKSARWAGHSQQVRVSLGRLYAAVSDAESGQRNYLSSGSREDLEEYKTHAGEADKEAAALAQLVADNPAQSRRAEAVQSVVGQRMDSLKRAVAAYQVSGAAPAKNAIANGQERQLRAAVRARVAQMDSAEETLFATREDGFSNDKVKTLVSLLLTVAVALVGFVVLFSGIRREMTTRAESERRLLDFKAALDEHAIVSITDVSGNLTYVNDKFCSLSKYSREELVGGNHRLINSGHHSKDFFGGLWKTISNGDVWKGEIKNRAKDGAFFWANTTIVPFLDAEGKPVQFIGIQAEITERKQAEESLRRSEENLAVTLNSIGDAVVASDSQGRITRMNPVAATLTGWSEAEAAGRLVDEVFRILNEDTRQPSVVPVAAVLATGEIHGLSNHAVLVARDGTECPIADSAAPIRDRAGVILGVVLVFRDVTAERRAHQEICRLNESLENRVRERTAQIHALNNALEQRVRERTRQLEESNKELESFSYSVSHDLRAPLRHVQGYVEMLRRAIEGQLTDKSRRYLKTITDASVEMGQLIDDLLAFSRMGRLEMQETPVLLDKLVQNVLHSLEMATKDRNIVWKIAPLPQVLGDPSALKQVLANLIANAVKYSRQCDPAEIEVGYAGEQEQRAVFFVRDNGAGFDMKYAHKLFGVFQRLHRAEEFEGTGIGLAIVRRVISRHDGRTWAEGALNKGATFYFTLKPAPLPSAQL